MYRVLVLVLLLVIAACGALVSSVVLKQPELSWLSVLLCVVGAAVLVVESVRRRRREASSPPAEHSAPTETGAAETELTEKGPVDESQAGSSTRSSRTTVSGESTGPLTATGSDARATTDVLAVDPGEENVDPVDMRQLGLSEVSVVVVDEHPRYHLDTCDWLGGRATIPLSLSEARELGFTPCALCMPVARLANRWRVSR